MATWTNQSKNIASFTNMSISGITGLTFADLPMSVLANIAFDQVVLDDGTTMENVAFDTLVPSWLIQEFIKNLWANQQKS